MPHKMIIILGYLEFKKKLKHIMKVTFVELNQVENKSWIFKFMQTQMK